MSAPGPRRRGRRRLALLAAASTAVIGLAAGLGVLLLSKSPAASPPPPPASRTTTLVCASGSLQLIGSSAFLPIAQEVADGYMNQCPGATITVTDGDSAYGLTQVRDAVRSGSSSAGSMIAMYDGSPSASVTAGLTPYPMGVLIYFVVAHAGLVPGGNITPGELRTLFVPPGKQGEIAVGRRSGSGSRETFMSQVLGLSPGPPPDKGNCPPPSGAAFSFTSCTEDSTADLLGFVNATPNAIGYAEISGPLTSYPEVSVITINGAGPTADNVRNGSYKFWTVEHLYAATRPTALAKDFLSFMPGYLASHLPRDFIPCAASIPGC